MACIFCEIASGQREAFKVFENDIVVAFLDTKPIFLGHTLVVPKKHFVSMEDMPGTLIHPIFWAVSLLSKAVRIATESDGIFTGININVSQSVKHLHIHIVPRKFKDGLFSIHGEWTRRKYQSELQMFAFKDKISQATRNKFGMIEF